MGDATTTCQMCGFNLGAKKHPYCRTCQRIRQKELKARRSRDEQLKKQLLAECGNICQQCGSQGDVMMHHVTEIRNGGFSTPENCILLCFDCHKAAHGGRAVGVARHNR